MVKFKLPAWLFDSFDTTRLSSEESTRKDVEVVYLFERFQQEQRTSFVPVDSGEVDPAMRHVMEGMPNSSFLCFNETDGGVVSGRRTELSLRYQTGYERLGDKGLSPLNDIAKDDAVTGGKSKDSDVESLPQDEAQQVDLRLVETGLGLVKSLTRINAGELQALHVPVSEDAQARQAVPAQESNTLLTPMSDDWN